MQPFCYAEETLDAIDRLKAARVPLNRQTLAAELRITPEAATWRMRRLHEMGATERLKARNKRATAHLPVDELRIRLDAVRAAARAKGQPLTENDLDQALGDYYEQRDAENECRRRQFRSHHRDDGRGVAGVGARAG
jgi:DNA-binding Lrp family transcriptional regulator